MCADYWGLPSGERGPAVISHIGSKREITMKTLIRAAIRCSLMSQDTHLPNPTLMKNLPKTLLAVLAAALVTTALSTHEAQATRIDGRIDIAGSAMFDSSALQKL